MRIGTMRSENIRIEQRSGDVDAEYGTSLGTWTTVHDNVPAEVSEVMPSRGESVADGISISLRPARVRIRYVDDVKAAMRIVRIDRGDMVMEVVGQPAELGNKERIEFMVQEYSPAGDQ